MSIDCSLAPKDTLSCLKRLKVLVNTTFRCRCLRAEITNGTGKVWEEEVDLWMPPRKEVIFAHNEAGECEMICW